MFEYSSSSYISNINFFMETRQRGINLVPKIRDQISLKNLTYPARQVLPGVPKPVVTLLIIRQMILNQRPEFLRVIHHLDMTKLMNHAVFDQIMLQEQQFYIKGDSPVL